MTLTKEEKKYLHEILVRELAKFKANEKTQFYEVSAGFLAAEHEYGHFLEALLKKLT